MLCSIYKTSLLIRDIKKVIVRHTSRHVFSSLDKRDTRTKRVDYSVDDVRLTAQRMRHANSMLLELFMDKSIAKILY